MAAAVVMLTTACGSDDPATTTTADAESSTSEEPSTAESQPGAEADPSPTEELAPLEAGDLTAVLSCAGLPTGERTVHTADSDPNELLGRPNGYTSRSDLVDTRVPEGQEGIDAGVVVEGFASNDDAQDRADYIATIIDEMDMAAFEEYDFVVGEGFLLRVDGAPTPDQAQEYADALADLPAGGPIEPCAATEVAAPELGDTPQEQSLLTVVGSTDALPAPDGEVSLVATWVGRSSIAFVAYNGTDEPVSRLAVSGRIVNGSGSTLATGESQGIQPNLVLPGGYAIGYVYGGASDDLPADAQLQDPAIDYETGVGQFENIAPLEASGIETLASGDVVGDVTNPHGVSVDGPLSVEVACLDGAGALAGQAGAFADRDALDPGQSSTFTLSTYGDWAAASCETLLIGASGYVDS